MCNARITRLVGIRSSEKTKHKNFVSLLLQYLYYFFEVCDKVGATAIGTKRSSNPPNLHFVFAAPLGNTTKADTAARSSQSTTHRKERVLVHRKKAAPSPSEHNRPLQSGRQWREREEARPDDLTWRRSPGRRQRRPPARGSGAS